MHLYMYKIPRRPWCKYYLRVGARIWARGAGYRAGYFLIVDQ